MVAVCSHFQHKAPGNLNEALAEIDKSLISEVQTLDNELQKKHSECEEFVSRGQDYQRKYKKRNLSARKPLFKDSMMIGCMHVKFSNCPEFKKCTVSGDNPLSFRVKVEEDNNGDFTELESIPCADEIGKIKDFEFVDPGFPPGEVTNVFTGENTHHKFTKSCALQKLYYELHKYMKAKDCKISGKIRFFESLSKKFKKNIVKNVESCRFCRDALDFLFEFLEEVDPKLYGFDE